MFRILRVQSQTINRRSRELKNLVSWELALVKVKFMRPKRSLLWFYLGILFWTIDVSFLTTASWSQQSISLPKDERLVPTEPRTPARSTPTFSPESPPPSDYSPPDFDDDNSQQFSVYRLDTGDSLSVNVPLFPEFSTVANIDEEGNIIMPILGRISLAGLTVVEAEQKIIYELNNRYLQEKPEVFVVLTAPRPAQVTILGEVVRPGFYSFISGSPLNVALTAAGGSTKDADLRSVVIRRSLVDGTIIEREIDLYTPLITSQALPDVRLQGGDTILINQLEVGTERDYLLFGFNYS